jgi:hypothetical protein
LYAVRALRGQWDSAAGKLSQVSPDWGWIVVATAIVLATYLLLIDTWRRIVVGTGQRLAFRDAARIWFVSNLGKYVPGKVWSIAAMTAMAREQKVSGVSAAGSSILVQVVSVAAGIGVALVAGAQTLDQPAVALGIALAIGASLAVIPAAIPLLGRLAGSITGKSVSLPALPASSIAGAVIRSVISWIAYGVAFQLFVRGVLGHAAGATLSYIAVYAASYIIGFLALFAPGGAVVRESAMVAVMLRLGLAGEADAIVVALASRVWLTVTEVLPGLAYLALGKPTPKIT